MVRERRGTGLVLWIRASARRKWKASMCFDGDAEPDAGAGAAALLATERRLGLGFGGGGGGERAVLFRAMKRRGAAVEGAEKGRPLEDRSRERELRRRLARRLKGRRGSRGRQERGR